jgi:hypothetical protein
VFDVVNLRAMERELKFIGPQNSHPEDWAKAVV